MRLPRRLARDRRVVDAFKRLDAGDDFKAWISVVAMLRQ
jgi:hypothetical protein